MTQIYLGKASSGQHASIPQIRGGPIGAGVGQKQEKQKEQTWTKTVECTFQV